jgi:ankyrin repeat protein
VEPGTGNTAFHAACHHNRAECAAALARAGCDVGIKDKNGETINCIFKGSKKIVFKSFLFKQRLGQ